MSATASQRFVARRGEHDRHHRQRADQHRALACAIDAPAALDEAAREPAAADAADIGQQVDGDERRPEPGEREPVFAVQELRQPEQEEPPDRIGHELRDNESPGLPMAQQLQPRHARGRLFRVAADVG